MAAHRYWRLYCTAGASPSFFDIQEIELRTAIGGIDQTGSGTASASSQAGGFEADKAFDNNNNTTWFTPGSNLPAWIKYDFGAGNDKDIVEVTLKAWNGGEMVTAFQLQYSDDNATWIDKYRVETGGWATGEVRAFSADFYSTSGGANTFWRVRTTAVNGSSVFGLAELEFYSGGINQCVGGAAFASSQQESPGPPALAFNGVKTDYWSASSITNQWIGYRFASARTITVIGITSRNPYTDQAPKDFVLERWDGSAYQVVMTLTGITGWTVGQTRYFNSGGETIAPVPGPTRVPLQVFVCT